MAFIEYKNVYSDGKRVMTLQQFKQWLKTFDKDGDSRLSKSELREVFRLTTGGLFAGWKSDKALKHADTDHDGFINDDEFRKLAQLAEKHLNIRITK